MARNLLGIRHIQTEEIIELLDLAADFKARVNADLPTPKLDRYVVGMLFFESSTRTRVSFEQAATTWG